MSYIFVKCKILFYLALILSTFAAEKEEHPKPNLTTKKPLTVHNVVVNQLEKKKGGSPMESPSLRKQTTTMQPLKEKEPETEDPEYGYIVLKNK